MRLLLLTLLLPVLLAGAAMSAHAGPSIKAPANFDNTISTLYRNGEKPVGAGDTCVTGFTCAARGTATCQFEAIDSDTQQITATTGDGYCVAVKTISSESDIHFLIRVLSGPTWNAETWAGGGIYYAQGSTFGTDDRSIVWWPQATTARFRHSEVTAPVGAAGLSGKSLAYYLGWEYEAATDESTAWETDDNVTIDQIGTARDFGELATGEYGLFAKSADENSSITMTFDVVEDNSTLDFTDAGSGGTPGSAPSTPVTPNFSGGPAWTSGFGQDDNLSTINSWLGYNADAITVWSTCPQMFGSGSTWTNWRNAGSSCYYWNWALDNMTAGALIVHSIPIWPNEGGSNKNCANPSKWDDAANGDFDAHYTALAQNLQAQLDAHGRSGSNLAIRLGWEMNGQWYAWAVCNKIAEFKTAWERWVDILRAEIPGVIIDWSPARIYPGYTAGINYGASGVCGNDGCSLSEWAPPADTYDVISRSTHDDHPFTIDQQTWDQAHGNDPNDKEIDFEELLTFAQSVPKKIAFSEWASNMVDCEANHLQSPEPETMFTFMYDFLDTNSDWIAWETYFSVSCTNLRSRQGTQGAITYKSLWTQ